MKYSIHVRPSAEIDLKDAGRWYENQREGLGEEFLDEVQNTWNIMAENPYLYPVVHRDTRRALIRRLKIWEKYAQRNNVDDRSSITIIKRQ